MSEYIDLLEALALKFPDSSKRTLKQWIKWGRVLVDGAEPTDFTIPKTACLDLVKKQLAPLPILYEDRWLIAIDKPAGLLSVPAERQNHSALSLLRAHYRCPHIYATHRLDQDASGVLLFARGEQMRERMAQLFGSHDLEREYAAIVEGRLASEEGMWDFPLEEREDFHVVVSDEGRPAQTYYHRLRRSARFSYLKIRLETGRKHQIRVHTAHIGHPIVGDKRYGSDCNPIKRLGLHALRLAFTHPETGKFLDIRAELPKAFKTLDFPTETK
ncbi:MAG: RluA family pseudouridine synthase [Verrucomicrobia bacterium]|nr:RluA family pseudouridine synthase [Verrucomicrobiota bacterium]MBS0647461.1 RluA family pseudouridine synthase [Verrucomicrobiota bacterium]